MEKAHKFLEKLLKHDLPEGDKVSEKLTGFASASLRTNAVGLKKRFI